MGLELDYIYGQTPLDEDEKEGLLIPTIATRGELDEIEQLNIEQAVISINYLIHQDNHTNQVIKPYHIHEITANIPSPQVFSQQQRTKIFPGSCFLFPELQIAETDPVSRLDGIQDRFQVLQPLQATIRIK